MKLRWKEEGEEGGQGENGAIILSNDMFINMLYISINQSIYSFSPMQEVAGVYTDIYYTYWTWYYS